MDRAELQRGVALFNAGHFFDAHEVLEDVWRAAPDAEKKYLQGLVQVAVGLHHYTQGNLVGARSVLARAHRNLRGAPADFAGLDVAALRRCLSACEGDLAAGDVIAAVPKLSLSR